MVEYITKSDAVFAACRVLDKFGGCHMGSFCPDSGCREVREVFKDVPAADVVEVRHGRWIKFSRGDVCSECQYQTGRYEHGGNYCPNCGADMRGMEEKMCEEK